MREFLTVLPFVLPCKFCRSSLTCYYQELPFEGALESSEQLSRWLWKIHNMVNAKLRGQGQTVAADPTFAAVQKIYTERLQYGCSRVDFSGWEFLFSVADNHPFRRGEASSPMPDAPPRETLQDTGAAELCRWNYLGAAERLEYIRRFWKVLPFVLPFHEWKKTWLQHADKLFPAEAWKRRQTTLDGLWKLRCVMERDLELLNKTQYKQLCNDLRLHRSGCGSSKRAKTCRRKRQHPK